MTTADTRTDKIDIMELPPRGPSQQSSTIEKSIEKPCTIQEAPVDFDKPLSRKGTHNPNALPHRDDKDGKEYDIGDLYDKAINRSIWSIDTASRPYLKYLKSLSGGWPHITWLADFMEVGTSPLKWRHLDQAEIENRAKRTRIAVLDFSLASATKRTDIQSSDRLRQLLADPNFNQGPAFARILVVEDLSRDVIEALGAQYDIDPLFFRSHISDYLWYNVKDAWVELNDLEHIARERNFFNIRYMRPRYFASEDSINKAIDNLGSFNVLRRLEQDLSWKVRKARKPKGHTVGLVRSKASLWIRNNKPDQKGILGILVVDPTLSEGYPLWGGPRNLQPCPSMHDEPLPPSPRGTSLFEDIIHYTSNMSKDDLKSIEKQHTALGIPILSLVAAEWLTVVNYITTGLTKIEWELEHPEYRKDDPIGLDSALERLHPLRRLIPVYRTFVKEVLTTVLAPSNIKSTPENPCHLQKLRAEFESILDRIDRLQTRTQNIISLATAIISIDENKRAMKMNSNLVRVTYLAVIFVPVQFVSSFFSMTPDLGSLEQTFWVYFVVAVPLTCLCLTIADPHRVMGAIRKIPQKARVMLRLQPKET